MMDESIGQRVHGKASIDDPSPHSGQRRSDSSAGCEFPGSISASVISAHDGEQEASGA